MKLHILDCSNYIYTNRDSSSYITRGVRETNGLYESNSAPIGAVKYLLQKIKSYMYDDSVIIPVFDSVPTIKKKMYIDTFGYDGYKSNRTKSTLSIHLQKDFSMWVLRVCGFPVQKVEEYESDDIIYTLVKMYKDDFSNIYIHTTDSDLTFLVSDNVEIAKVGDSSKIINIGNYMAMAITNKPIFYNTIHFMKLYKGDRSDNIPGIGLSWAEIIDKYIPSDQYRNLGDLDLCRSYLRKVVMDNSIKDNSHLVIPTFNIINPLLVPYDKIDNYDYEVDKEKFYRYFCNNFCESNDKWGLEQKIEEFIDSHYE